VQYRILRALPGVSALATTLLGMPGATVAEQETTAAGASTIVWLDPRCDRLMPRDATRGATLPHPETLVQHQRKLRGTALRLAGATARAGARRRTHAVCLAYPQR
jgi:hypothetical protein